MDEWLCGDCGAVMCHECLECGSLCSHGIDPNADVTGP